MTATSMTGAGTTPTPADIERYRAQLSDYTTFRDQCINLSGILSAVIKLAAEAHTCDRQGYCTTCRPLRHGLAAIAAFDTLNPRTRGGAS